jgi:hypothetical protein
VGVLGDIIYTLYNTNASHEVKYIFILVLKHVAGARLGKIFMIQEAIRLNPFNSEWFAWNDAGNAAFRVATPLSPPLNPLIPWPHPNALAALPKGMLYY